jgi:hypothetical protein
MHTARPLKLHVQQAVTPAVFAAGSLFGPAAHPNPLVWGSQSWLQPPFRRLSSPRQPRLKSRPIANRPQVNNLPHNPRRIKP